MARRWSYAPKFARPSLECLEKRETPAAGLLDPTFGNGGLIVSSVGQVGQTVAVQPDGKILVGSSITTGSVDGVVQTALFRFNADGTVDHGFGNNGIVKAPFTTIDGGNQHFAPLLVQPDGKIIVDCASFNPGSFSQVLVRLTTSGQLDPTFGTAGTVSDQIDGQTFVIDQVLLEANGKLAVLAGQSGQIAVMHYTVDGKPDSTFGNDGLVPITHYPPDLQDITLQADGKLLILEAGGSIAAGSILVARFNANGSADKTFDGFGSVLLSHPGLFQDPSELGGLTIQPDGKILVTDGTDGNFAVVRVNADGTLDKGFGTGGFASVHLGNGPSAAPKAAVQPDGKILLGGADLGTVAGVDGLTDAFALVRLTSAGLPDASFGAAGVVVTYPTGKLGGSIDALTLQPDGKVVVVGEVGPPTDGGLALARYQTTGSVAAPTGSITSLSAPPAVFDAAVTLTATVTAAHGTPTGSVTFLDGGTILGAAAVGGSLGQATLTVPGLSTATHHITAEYSGDQSHQFSSATATLTVTRGTANVQVMASNPTPRFGQPVTLTANVWPVDIPNGSVTFLDGRTVLGTATLHSMLPAIVSTAVLTLSNLRPGIHAITVLYSGDANFVPGVSGAITVTVASPPPVASTTRLAAPKSVIYGKPVTLTATITGAKNPTGTVTFRDGTTVLGSAPLGVSGKAEFPSAHLGAGTHHITASYSGDADDLSSVSAAVAIAVARAGTQITSSGNPPAVVAGQPITLTALVVSSVPGEVLNTGSITFMDGTNLLGTVLVKKGVATLKVPHLSAGKHTITVSYGGDANHTGATSTITFIVEAAT